MSSKRYMIIVVGTVVMAVAFGLFIVHCQDINAKKMLHEPTPSKPSIELSKPIDKSRLPTYFQENTKQDKKYIIKTSIDESELSVVEKDKSGVYKVEMLNEYTLKNNEKRYKFNLENIDIQNINIGPFDMSESEYNDKIGVNSDAVKLNYYELEITCPVRYDCNSGYIYGMTKTYTSNSLLGEQKFSTDNSSELINKAFDGFKESLSIGDTGGLLSMHYNPPKIQFVD